MEGCKYCMSLWQNYLFKSSLVLNKVNFFIEWGTNFNINPYSILPECLLVDWLLPFFRHYCDQNIQSFFRIGINERLDLKPEPVCELIS